MLALMAFGASGAVRADENKPVTEGNAVTVHVIEKDSEENLPGAVIKIEEAGLAAVIKIEEAIACSGTFLPEPTR